MTQFSDLRIVLVIGVAIYAHPPVGQQAEYRSFALPIACS